MSSGNYRGDNDDISIKGENVGTGDAEKIKSHEQRLYTTLVGENGDRASVTPDGFGVNRIATDAVVTVVSQLGFDDIADTWFAIGLFTDSTGVGGTGDDIRVQIAAGDDATRYPAIDVTYTVQASDVSDPFPELAVAAGVVGALNADATFKAQWTAQTVLDNGIIHISSDLKGEMGERTTANAFQVTTTGTTTVTIGFSTIKRRNKTTSLARDPEDPRIGILGISGNVQVTPGAIGDLFITNAKNGGSADLRVNGSGTPVTFSIAPVADKDIFIEEIRFYGGGNGIQYGNFLSQNSALTNGITLNIKSDDELVNYPFMIKTTEDFKNKFAWGTAANWNLNLISGTDQFLATWVFVNPFPLRAIGSFAIDDYLNVVISDNLTTGGITELEFAAFGFEKEI
jgi:hypothetical protein